MGVMRALLGYKYYMLNTNNNSNPLLPKLRFGVVVAMKRHCILLVSIAFLCVLVFSDAGRSEALVGGWTPIKDLKDPYVLEIANYAVTEYNKRYEAKLKLLSVVKGQTQVVAGTNYRLVLKAKDDSATNNYEAIVWDRIWLHSRNLTSFKLLHS